MPTYDYECGACGEVSEIFQRITEAPKRKCPQCGKLRLKRLLGSGAGFLFRGSGFYITDYRSSEYRSKAKAESDSGKSSKESKPSKGESGSSSGGGGSGGEQKSANSSVTSSTE